MADARGVESDRYEELGAFPGIPQGGGLRKIRLGAEDRGKRGGTRVIYYWAQDDGTLPLMNSSVRMTSKRATKQQHQTRRTPARAYDVDLTTRARVGRCAGAAATRAERDRRVTG